MGVLTTEKEGAYLTRHHLFELQTGGIEIDVRERSRTPE